MSFEYALQQALFNKLTTNVELMPLITGVYDHVPQKDARFPYVTIGDAEHTDWSTATDSGQEVTTTIHVWSRFPERSQTKQIQGAIYNALHRADITLTGFVCLSCDLINSQSFIDEDGITRHGVQQFRLLLTE